jgi:polyadenylation factor subunit 2
MASGAPPPPLPFPLPGLNGAPPPPLPGFDPSTPPDPQKLLEMMQKAGVQLPPPGQLPPGLIPPPGGLPPPGNFPFPPPPPPPPGGSMEDNVRRRGPLPSQADSLKQEQKAGRYTRAR